jgi:hypothetical protein
VVEATRASKPRNEQEEVQVRRGPAPEPEGLQGRARAAQAVLGAAAAGRCWARPSGLRSRQEWEAHRRLNLPRASLAPNQNKVEVIRLLVTSYFDIVRHNLADMVPKCLMRHLVRHV